MPFKPFDAATKQLVELRPADWITFLGLPLGAGAELIETDLATITTEADKAVRVQTDPPYLLHVEFQAGKDDIAERALRYNVMLWYRHKLPVESVLVLLRPQADLPQNNGHLQITGQNGAPVVDFRYRVLRVWEQDTTAFLQGGLSLLPLAPLANVSESGLPNVVGQMQARMVQENQTAAQARFLWTATYLLLGLRHEADFINNLLKGVLQLQESTTYQAIWAEGERKGRNEGRNEGRVEGERLLFMRLATQRLGKPSLQTETALDRITAPEDWEKLADRLLGVETWDELLNGETDK